MFAAAGKPAGQNPAYRAAPAFRSRHTRDAAESFDAASRAWWDCARLVRASGSGGKPRDLAQPDQIKGG
jgi:hypothetical protein